MARPLARSWAVCLGVCLGWGAAWAAPAAVQARQASVPEVTIKDRQSSDPLVLAENADYTLENVSVGGVIDSAALTLTGRINSVKIHHGHFGQVTAGVNGRAAALEAVGASVGRLEATDSAFVDAENALVSLREGAFGTVTFQHCTFKASDAFLKRMYAQNPWRTWPPVTEFYNIDRLELLDNEYANTTILIHPSVKLVIFRGDISKVQLESPNTQVLRLAPREEPPVPAPEAGTFAGVAGEAPAVAIAIVAADAVADTDSRIAPAADWSAVEADLPCEVRNVAGDSDHPESRLVPEPDAARKPAGGAARFSCEISSPGK